MASVNDIGVPGQPMNTPPLTPWQAAVRDVLDGSDVPISDRLTKEIPTGSIVMFGSAVPPEGWALCDGSAHGSVELANVIGSPNTPNLTDRFIMGAGTTYPQGATGGSATHSHPLHPSRGMAMLVTTAEKIYQGRSGAINWTPTHQVIATSGGSFTTAQTVATGLTGNTNDGGAPPVFYALTFIIKKGAT